VSYLIDTNWVISFLNGKADAVGLLGNLANEGIAISIITWGEIYEGLLSASSQQHRLAQFESFVATVDLLTLNTDVAQQYGTIRSHLRLQGLLIPDNDIWIAATALAYNYTLVSQDKHFSRVPNLTLY